MATDIAFRVQTHMSARTGQWCIMRIKGNQVSPDASRMTQNMLNSDVKGFDSFQLCNSFSHGPQKEYMFADGWWEAVVKGFPVLLHVHTPIIVKMLGWLWFYPKSGNSGNCALNPALNCTTKVLLIHLEGHSFVSIIHWFPVSHVVKRHCMLGKKLVICHPSMYWKNSNHICVSLI